MKSGNYDELIDKFYAGRASAEEISILKSEGLLDEQDIFYAQALHSEREQKMDWDFADFMKEIPAAKEAALPGRRIWMKRMMAAAATVATILLAYIFWPQHDNTGEVAHVPVISKQIDSNHKVAANPPVPEMKDSILLSEDVKKHPRAIISYTVKTRKQNPPKSNKEAAKDKEEATASDENFMVMVNGKPITDEADAIAIMKESLSMISRDLTHTVNELKPIGQIKIKL